MRSRERWRARHDGGERDGTGQADASGAAFRQAAAEAHADHAASALAGGDGGLSADPPGARRSDRADAGRGGDGGKHRRSEASISIRPAAAHAVLRLLAWDRSWGPGPVAAAA